MLTGILLNPGWATAMAALWILHKVHVCAPGYVEPLWHYGANN